MKYKLTIPEPCHEDWSKMTPVEKGRFCDKCQKCVVDFTAHSNAQMYHHINSGNDLCGRFRPDQLNRDLTAAPVRKGLSFQWALTSLLAFVGLNDGFSQSEEQIVVGRIAQSQTQTAPETSLQEEVIKSDTITISGTIKDSATGEKLPFANIVCSKLKIGTASDMDGNFILKFPASKLRNNIEIEISFLGFETLKVNLDTLNFAEAHIFTLKEANNEFVTMGIIICEEKPTFWQRTGNWFKRVFY